MCSSSCVGLVLLDSPYSCHLRRGTARESGLPPISNRRTHSPVFKAGVAMEAISGRKAMQEIVAEHAMGMRNAAQLPVRHDSDKTVEAAAARCSQRAAYQGQTDKGQGGATGQGS